MKNLPSAYGKSIRCVADADEFWTGVTGIDLVKQDLIHVFTTTDFLGPGGDARGFDVREMLGMPTPVVEIMGPFLEHIARRDERVLDANVTIAVTPATSPGGEQNITISISGETALGPFSLVLSVNDLADTYPEADQ